MKIVEQLKEAIMWAQAAQAKVDRLVAEIEAKTDGRRVKRKPRKKRAVKAKAE